MGEADTGEAGWRGRRERQWASHMSSNPGLRSLCNHEPTSLYLKSFIWKYKASAFIKTDTRVFAAPQFALFQCVYLCMRIVYMGACMHVHMWSPEADIRCPQPFLYFFFLRLVLSLNLKFTD